MIKVLFCLTDDLTESFFSGNASDRLAGGGLGQGCKYRSVSVLLQ